MVDARILKFSKITKLFYTYLISLKDYQKCRNYNLRTEKNIGDNWKLSCSNRLVGWQYWYFHFQLQWRKEWINEWWKEWWWMIFIGNEWTNLFETVGHQVRKVKGKAAWTCQHRWQVSELEELKCYLHKQKQKNKHKQTHANKNKQISKSKLILRKWMDKGLLS